jgi:hypothetical protein
LKPDAAAGTELLEVLERFCSAFADRDAEAAMQLLVPDPEVVVITITTTAGCLGRSTVPHRTDDSAASRWKRSSTPRLARCSLRTICERAVRPGEDDCNPRRTQARGGRWGGRLDLVPSSGERAFDGDAPKHAMSRCVGSRSHCYCS